jgi:predicted alpha/beta hydrolase family esterase
MHGKHQLLFVQGGGQGVHAEWDSKLVDSLRRELGPEYEIHYPRMPNEADPKYASWQKALARELEKLQDGAILVAHSVGGTILLKVLTELRPVRKLGALFFLSTPFVGDGGWSGDDLRFPADLATQLPRGVPIHFYQGLEDQNHAAVARRAVRTRGSASSRPSPVRPRSSAQQ